MIIMCSRWHATHFNTTSEHQGSHLLTQSMVLLQHCVEYPIRNHQIQEAWVVWKSLSLAKDSFLFIYLGFNITFNTLYRSYHTSKYFGQRKPVHRVVQGSVL